MNRLRPLRLLLALTLPALSVSGCATTPEGKFWWSYSNGFATHYAFVATAYHPLPVGQTEPDGEEADNFDNPNLDAYSAGQNQELILGFRTLELQNLGGSAQGTFEGMLIPPGKSDGPVFARWDVDIRGGNAQVRSQIGAPALKSYGLSATYPVALCSFNAPMLLALYGPGQYTAVWTMVKTKGEPDNRELSRISFNLNP